MKKLIIIILVVLCTSGCIKINNASIEAIVNTTINSKYHLYNRVNSGYKYYLPRTLKTTITNEFNEIIKSKYYDYYLYVDLVAYYNKKEVEYVEDNNIYYSKLINKDEKKGIINIKEINNNYLVNVRYNYAKVEVLCAKDDLNEVINNALVITSSINYQDAVIRNLLNDNEFTSVEEQVNIFEKEKNETNTLENYDDTYTGNELDDYDPDVIKERSWILWV